MDRKSEYDLRQAAALDSERDDDMLSAVRKMMAADVVEAETPRDSLETTQRTTRKPAVDGATHNRSARPVLPNIEPEPKIETAATVPQNPAVSPGLRGRISRWVTFTCDPTWKKNAFILFIAAMLYSPWLIPGLLFLSLWIGLIIYFTIGPERISEFVVMGWGRFEQLSPDQAARILGKIQNKADQLDGWLARLPERWTDGVYLPDLGRSHAIAPLDEDDPFDRLAAEQQSGQHEATQA